MDLVASPQDEYEVYTFKALNVHGQEISEVAFYDCVFRDCAFVETTFRDCKFVDCAFKDCDLSLMRVDNSAFTNTRFESSRVIGVDWTVAYWPRIGGLESINFFDCALNFSTFIGLNLKKVNMANCVARDVDFTEANLTQANCRGTDFSESRFSSTDLTGADFTLATNYVIDASTNKLKKTKFSLPEAVSLLRSLDIILVDPDDADVDNWAQQ